MSRQIFFVSFLTDPSELELDKFPSLKLSSSSSVSSRFLFASSRSFLALSRFKALSIRLSAFWRSFMKDFISFKCLRFARLNFRFIFLVIVLSGETQLINAACRDSNALSLARAINALVSEITKDE